jgi:hypothetical protein
MGTKTVMSVKTFLEVASRMPNDISILIRGKHGIGKSQLVKRLAEKVFSLPLIDRRLSQMSEGDVIGLPKVEGGVTRFLPPDWYMRACNEPCVLFLDELNRALPEVMQASFQIVLDRELNGHKLHPQTRVFSAVNIGAEYSVNEMDPALLRRFWTIDLDPTPEEWIEGFARGYLDDIITDFIASNHTWLNPNPKEDLTDVHPTRHSYERLDKTLKYMNKLASGDDTEILDPNDPLFYHTCCGFIGTEASIALRDFAVNVDRRVSGEELLNKYSKVRTKVQKMGQEKWVGCIEKLADELTKLNKLTNKQTDNIEAFMKDLPGELRVALWTKLTQSSKDKIEGFKGALLRTRGLIMEVFGVPIDEKGVAPAPSAPSAE